MIKKLGMRDQFLRNEFNDIDKRNFKDIVNILFQDIKVEKNNTFYNINFPYSRIVIESRKSALN